MTTICPIKSFVDYITDPKNVWDKTKYVPRRTVSGIMPNGNEFSFRFTYVLGNAFMEGTFGKDADIVEVAYRSANGFAVRYTSATGTVSDRSFTLDQSDLLLADLLSCANA